MSAITKRFLAGLYRIAEAGFWTNPWRPTENTEPVAPLCAVRVCAVWFVCFLRRKLRPFLLVATTKQANPTTVARAVCLNLSAGSWTLQNPTEPLSMPRCDGCPDCEFGTGCADYECLRCGSKTLDPIVGCVPCLQDFMIEQGHWMPYPETEA